jgi:hypothetical protein
MAEEMNDPWTQAAALLGLARYAYTTGQNAKALDLLGRAETLARQIQDVAIIRRVETLRDQLPATS